jgi:cardiolipin synthase
VPNTTERFHDETARIATLPNFLTVIRLILVIPFAWLAAKGEDGAALFIFFIAGLSDGLDGHLARRLGQRSKWGRLLDPLADKILTNVAFVVLSLFRGEPPFVPLWLAGAVVARDILIVGGAGLVYAKVQSSAFRPTVSGKINTLLEIGVVILFLASSRWTGLRPVLPPLYVVLLISIVVSATDYVRQGVRMVRRRPIP